MLKILVSMVFTLGLVLGSSVSAFSEDVYAEIVDYGIYTNGVNKTVKKECPSVGSREAANEFQMEKTTTNIPMRRGSRFGVLFKLKGKPEGAKIKLRTVTVYPEQGMTHPINGKTYHKNEFYFTYTVGCINAHLQGFDEPSEMVPGQWTFQIWNGNNKLLEKRLTTYKP